MNHPRRRNAKGKRVPYSILCSHTGFHFCCRCARRTHFKDFGVGVSLYFKFLKYMIMIFTLVSILNVPAFTFFIGANTADSSTARTTLGNLGSSQMSCGSLSSLNSSIFFSCSYGTLKQLGVFGMAIKESSCGTRFGANLKVDSSCNIYSEGNSSIAAQDKFSILQLFNGCIGSQTCNFDVSKLTITDPTCRQN